MIATATVIIGANFGDEGKGSLTDYHAKPGSMVVRFNGGAQCSHTVERHGKKHIFRHFGSGSLQGAPTFLSRFFIHNPILYFKELEVLRTIGCEPQVYVDPSGFVTTPWDMMINQMIEEQRGENRHGSCGVGINETIQRNIRFPLHVSVLAHKLATREMCRSIMHDWVSIRLEMLSIDATAEWQQRLQSKEIFDKFLEYCDEYVRSARVMPLQQAMAQESTADLLFEGGQGLLLDQDHYFFPHVTHSSTGSKNVSVILAEGNIRDVDLVYVTRAYMTRHGAGPLPHEEATLSYEDTTNVPNDWQGTIRFAHLDLDLLAESISDDQMIWRDANKKLAITCLDQMPEQVPFWHYGQLRRAQKFAFVRHICETVEVKACFMGFGPTAAHIMTSVV